MNAHFPVTSSVLSASHLAGMLNPLYGWDNASCRIIKAGINHSYLVYAGRAQYVLRIYTHNWRSRSAIEQELGLILRLKENGLPVAYPVADLQQHFIQELLAPEGLRYAVLFSYAQGKKLLSYPAEIHYAAGRIMAELHSLTRDLELDARPVYTRQTLLDNTLDRIKAFLPDNPPELDFMHGAHRFLSAMLSDIDEVQLRKGIVHLDIWFDNLNIDDQGQITLFDFDFCGSGWLCLDLAYYILQLHSVEKDPAEKALKTERFLQGYESITPVSAEEKRLLPALGVSLYFFYLGIQCQRFDDWSNVFLHDIHLKRYINLLIRPYFEAHYELH